jgi:hypothetical protein
VYARVSLALWMWPFALSAPSIVRAAVRPALMNGTWSLANGDREVSTHRPVYAAAASASSPIRSEDGCALQQDGRGGGVAGGDHVHVQDCPDPGPVGRREGGDILEAPVQSLLLTAEQDEPKFVLPRVGGEHPAQLQQARRTAGVVVGAARIRRGAARKVDRIEVRGDQDQPARACSGSGPVADHVLARSGRYHRDGQPRHGVAQG